MATPAYRKKLSRDLESSREAMTAYVTALRHDLNFVARLKRSVGQNPLAWYAGAAVLGLLLSKIPPFRRKVVVQGPKLHSDAPKEAGSAALIVTVLKFALDLAKPALLRGFKEWMSRRRPGTAPR